MSVHNMYEARWNGMVFWCGNSQKHFAESEPAEERRREERRGEERRGGEGHIHSSLNSEHDIHAYIHTFIHTFIHSYIHACIHTYENTSHVVLQEHYRLLVLTNKYWYLSRSSAESDESM